MICNRINDIIGLQTGGAQQHINKGNIENLVFDMPPADVIEKFSKIVKPMFNKIILLTNESLALKKAKDIYLKKFFG